MTWTQIGVFLWGTVTIALSVFCVSIITFAAFYINGDGKLVGAPPFVTGAYFVLKDNGSLVAGILGFSALAWAYFFQALK
jgi:hypothetical protein